MVLHDGRNDALIRRVVETVKGVELIELAVQTSVNLHHATQTTAQVVEICQYFAHPRLGASFN